MHIQTLPVGEFQANCYIIWSASRAAIIVDPGAEPANIIDVIRAEDLTVVAYVQTHGHVDHMSALADLSETLPAPIGLHRSETDWAFDPVNQWLPFYSTPRRPARIERLLAEPQEWSDGGLRYRVMATPGHTPGSVCFHFPDHLALFTGDTLFAGSVGRTDLPGGDSRQLQASLSKIAQFPDATIIYPGHGPATTLKQEKKYNFFMRSLP